MMRGATFKNTEAEIAHLCSYIKDDGTVATYCSVSREVVAGVRAKIITPKTKRRHYLSDRALPDTVHVGMDGDVMRKSAAEGGSTRLYTALERLFVGYEQKHGLKRGEGLVVQLYGWATLNRLHEQSRQAA